MGKEYHLVVRLKRRGQTMSCVSKKLINKIVGVYMGFIIFCVNGILETINQSVFNQDSKLIHHSERSKVNNEDNETTYEKIQRFYLWVKKENPSVTWNEVVDYLNRKLGYEVIGENLILYQKKKEVIKC